jgi:hypothetical protein
MKHKHYDLIVAWAGGQKIEYQTSSGGWVEIKDISWDEGNIYRIKQEPVIYNLHYQYKGCNHLELVSIANKWDLKLTFTDGKLTGAEVSND